MNKQIGLFCLFMLLAVSVSAQGNYPVADFEEMVENANGLLDTTAYRLKIVTEDYSKEGGQLNSIVDETTTFLPLSSTHYIWRKIEDERTVFVREVITIRDFRYIRENEGAWKKEKARPDMFTVKEDRFDEKLVEFKGEKEIGGRKVRHFVLTAKRTFNGKASQYTKEFWFDDKDRLLKLISGVVSGYDSTYRKVVQDYSYDLRGIKIEAPIP